MYEAYYGFREKPFALSPDPKYLFLSATHREVLGHLIYGIEQGEGFIAITGEVGTGKTTLCRTLLQRLGRESEVAFLFNPNLSPTDLVKAVNAEFGLPTFGDSIPELTEVLNRFLVEKKREGRRALLIVDEAQNLSMETLEEIRLLSNLETETSKLIQIVLLGQPELDHKLEAPELRQLRQRISVWWHLGPLSADETREYVRHRLRIAAGVDRQWFTEEALALIHRLAGGIPRLVNVLCDRALLAGYGENAQEIDRATVLAIEKEVRPRPALSARRRRRLPAIALAGAAGLGVIGVVGIAIGLLWRAPERAEPQRGVPERPVREVAQPPVQEAPPARAVVPEMPSPPTTAPPVATTPRASRTDPVPGSGSDASALSGLLELGAPDRANAQTVDAALRAWGLPEIGAERFTLAEALDALSQAGLASLPLTGASVPELRELDLPVLLLLGDADGGTRAAYLRMLSGDRAWIEGLLPERTVRVPLGEIEAHWTGQAHAFWRDFEDLPPVLRAGDGGAVITWLQRALGSLGFYAQPANGAFDDATREAVRAFQSAQGLEPDGAVGPRTKIRLYTELGRYRVPALVEGEVGLARSR